MDTRVKPCEDFYQFACGRWPEAHIIEGTSNSWFSDRTRYLNSKMEGILSENVTKEDPLPLASAKSLFASCLDTEKMDQLGLEPMLDVLERAGLPKTLPDETTAATFSISKSLARIQRVLSMDILIQLSMAISPKTNKTIMVVLSEIEHPLTYNVPDFISSVSFAFGMQAVNRSKNECPFYKEDTWPAIIQSFEVSPTLGSSSLPELVSTEKRVYVNSREALSLRLAYMTGIMSALQPNTTISELGAAALKILVVDSQVRSDIQKSDSNELPSMMTLAELQEMMDTANTTGTPRQRFDWMEYVTVLLDGLGKGVSVNDTVYVDSPDFFVLLAQRLHRNRPETYQRYLWWFLVTSMVPHSSEELRSLKDDLYEALFRRPRQTRAAKCVKYVKTFFNMAISYKFAKMDNLKETTAKVRSMLSDITDSFSRLVDSLQWMDDATKKNAAKKARAIKSFIGYPDWLAVPGQLEELYQGMEVIDGQFLQSMVGLKSVEVKNILKTLGEPPANDTKGWVADPLDVNAFYGRGSNAIAIPAGILQSPFYYLGLEALNYGAIGSILGHELTHAFDIEGKDFDETGKKVSWWDEAMSKAYDERAQCFINQYDQFGYNSKNKLNGSLTLAENIADNGGLREAFHAYEHYIDRNGDEPKLPGLEMFSHKQLFFMAFANVWCEKSTLEEDIISLTDVHSPNKFRVIGTLRNLDVFSEVWGCPKGSGMNPGGKCVLW